MLLDLNTFLYDKIADQIFVSHLDKKIKFDIVEPDKIGSKFKSAMEKQGMLKDIKGADLIVRFAEKIEAQPPEDEEKPEDSEDTEDNGEENTEEETSEKTDSEDSENEEGEDKEETDDAEETTDDSTDDSTEEDAGEDKEEASDDTEETDDKEEEEDDEDDKEEGLNESVKIQDLTKSMLITPKKSKASTGSSKASSPKKESKKCTEAEDEKKSEKKTDKKPAKKTEKKSEKKETKEIIEAETKVTGDELKLRVQKATARVFNIDKDKIEFVDVPECVDGYNIYYCKISFKDRPDQTEED